MCVLTNQRACRQYLCLECGRTEHVNRSEAGQQPSATARERELRDDEICVSSSPSWNRSLAANSGRGIELAITREHESAYASGDHRTTVGRTHAYVRVSGYDRRGMTSGMMEALIHADMSTFFAITFRIHGCSRHSLRPALAFGSLVPSVPRRHPCEGGPWRFVRRQYELRSRERERASERERERKSEREREREEREKERERKSDEREGASEKQREKHREGKKKEAATHEEKEHKRTRDSQHRSTKWIISGEKPRPAGRVGGGPSTITASCSKIAMGFCIFCVQGCESM